MAKVNKKARKRRKSTSRSSRLADEVDLLRVEVAKLQAVVDSEVKPEDKIISANEILSGIGYSGIEDLRDEIQSWKENIEEKFSATQKYSDLEECESELESVINEIESGTESVDAEYEIESRIQSIESGLDSCDNVNFPGMF